MLKPIDELANSIIFHKKKIQAEYVSQAHFKMVNVKSISRHELIGKHLAHLLG